MADDAAVEVRYRPLAGTADAIARLALALIGAIGLIWAGGVLGRVGIALFTEQYLASFLGLALIATFLLVPAGRRVEKAVPWYDAVLAFAAAACAAYVVVLYPKIAFNLASVTADRLAVAAIGMLLILEATRRMFGWALVIIALAVCLYAGFAYLFPGLLYGRGASAQRILSYTYFDTNGVFGIALNVTATIVIAYIFFGVCLAAVGAEEFFTQIAMALMGRFRGGAAKISIMSSILFGTVSGSAVANVVVGGMITIRMMIRNGYPPHVAAAIEAVSSTGGQIMPPVMGITAFLIAENLDLSYGEVALAALVPALLYYFSLFLQADLEAAKSGLRGLPVADLPRARDVLRSGWVFLLPIAVLVYMLIVAGYPADVSGIAAAVTTLAGALVRGFDHLRPARLLRLLELTGRAMLDITVVCALAGIVMGALNLSGILFKMTLILSTVSFGHPGLLLAIVAVVCIVLGMGLPSIVIYVLLAVLVAPALVSLGIEPLAAHLFIFYFGMLSMITPPICLATFAACAIAGSKLWPTGWAGMRLGVVAYVVPFIFAFHPTLLMRGAWYDIVIADVTAVAGVALLAVGCAGYLFRRLGIVERGLFALSGVALIPAPTSWTWIVVNLAGALVAAVLVLLQWMGRARERSEGTA